MIPLNPEQVARLKKTAPPSPLAIHEAGHVALSHQHGWAVETVTVQPAKQAGCARYSQRALPPEDSRIGQALRQDYARYCELQTRQAASGLDELETAEANEILDRFIGSQEVTSAIAGDLILAPDYYVVPEDTPEQRREYLIPRIEILLAGLCAEEHFLGGYHVEGAAKDERKARHLVSLIAPEIETEACYQEIKAAVRKSIAAKEKAILTLARELTFEWTLDGEVAFKLLDQHRCSITSILRPRRTSFQR